MKLKEAINKLKETQDSYLKDELDEAIETVIGELFAIQNLLDEKNEEIEHLQKENGKLTRARKWFVEHTVGQIATPEMLRKILAEEYIHKDKIKDCLEDIEDYFENVSVPKEDIEFIKEKRKDLLKEE